MRKRPGLDIGIGCYVHFSSEVLEVPGRYLELRERCDLICILESS